MSRVETKYALAFYTSTGDYLGELHDLFSLQWQWHENMLTTAVAAVVPTFFDGVRKSWLTAYNRVRIMRSVNGAVFYPVENVEWFLLRWVRQRERSGRSLVLHFSVANSVLGTETKGRIVAFKAASSEASKAGEVDSIAKDIVAENMGSGATDYGGTVDRDISTYFSIDDDLPSGSTPSTTKSFSMKPIRRILDSLAAYAYEEDGTVWLYDVVIGSGNKLRFVTWIGHKGMDRSDDVIFSWENGNVESITFDFNYFDEVNAVYVGGQGTEASRTFRYKSDDNAIALSPWSRQERMRSYPALSTTTALDDVAEAELTMGAARESVSVTIAQAPGAIYGVDWKGGDVVGWVDSDTGRRGSDRIAGVSVSYQSGRETVKARLYSGFPLAGFYSGIDESDLQL